MLKNFNLVILILVIIHFFNVSTEKFFLNDFFRQLGIRENQRRQAAAAEEERKAAAASKKANERVCRNNGYRDCKHQLEEHKCKREGYNSCAHKKRLEDEAKARQENYAAAYYEDLDYYMHPLRR